MRVVICAVRTEHLLKDVVFAVFAQHGLSLELMMYNPAQGLA